MKECTISDVCMDYLVKNNFDMHITYRSVGDGEELIDWAAERADIGLYATDPVRLVGLYMIRKDWISKKKVPNYLQKLEN
ncbi:MAG: hypothetical protein K2M91_06595 [Lachnospiraceae bacterium]|nr:hypothetical protein [Lachnospiraceae bacterium]